MLVIALPMLTKSTPYTVLTSSMTPSYPAGTLVIVKPTDAQQIRIGDVVTYQLESNQPAVVTHRVIQIVEPTTPGGTESFITKGDANSLPDAAPVKPVQVRGVVWYAVPYIGWVNNVVNGDARAVIVPIVAGGLFLYAGYMGASTVVDRRRKARARPPLRPPRPSFQNHEQTGEARRDGRRIPRAVRCRGATARLGTHMQPAGSGWAAPGRTCCEAPPTRLGWSGEGHPTVHRPHRAARAARARSTSSPPTCAGRGTSRRSNCSATSRPRLWDEQGKDPIGLLGEVAPARLAELAADEAFVGRANALRDDLRAYLSEPRWYQIARSRTRRGTIAYFSPEFGIAAALPQYSGGLGILAGDHLKSASDLGVPIVGVGLFYRAGYFRQSISRDGWQEESYPVLDPDGLPMRVLRNPDGTAAAGRARAARRPSAARPHLAARRRPRHACCCSTPTCPRTPRSCAASPTGSTAAAASTACCRSCCSASAAPARSRPTPRWPASRAPRCSTPTRATPDSSGSSASATSSATDSPSPRPSQAVRAGTVFTTHTPVPAGIDRFDAALVERYFSTELLPGVDVDDVLALGAEDYEGGDARPPSTWPSWACASRQRANGVSQAARRREPAHVRRALAGLRRRRRADHLDHQRRARADLDRPAGLASSPSRGSAPQTPPSPTGRRRRGQRRRTLGAARPAARAARRPTPARASRRPGPSRTRASAIPTWFGGLLDPEVLTIGFARRVPTYKRLTLMLHDPERLRALLTHPSRPVQIVIAGKSHPADDEGKRLIQQLVEFSQEADVRERIVFLPNYDIGMAQLLYPGTDVWLNNPLRPLEACGTSGMKAALNGSLNLSILDGWWAEYYDERERLGDPVGRQRGRRRRARRARGGIPVRPDRAPDRAAVLRPRGGRRAHALGRRHPAHARHAVARALGRPHGARVRRAAVPARPRPPSERSAPSRLPAGPRPRRVEGARPAAWPRCTSRTSSPGEWMPSPQVGEQLHVRAFVELGEPDPRRRRGRARARPRPRGRPARRHRHGDARPRQPGARVGNYTGIGPRAFAAAPVHVLAPLRRASFGLHACASPAAERTRCVGQ